MRPTGSGARLPTGLTASGCALAGAAGLLVVHCVAYQPGITYLGHSIPFYSRLYSEFKEYGLFLILCDALLLAGSVAGWAGRSSASGRLGGASALGVLLLEVIWQIAAPGVIVPPPIH